WHGGTPLTVTRAELPGTNEDDARRLLDHCAEILMSLGFTEIAANQATNGNGADHAAGAVDPFETLENMRPSDADVSDKQPRIIMSLLRRVYHPEEIQQIVVDGTMKVVAGTDLGWTWEVEEEAVRIRLNWAVDTLCKEYNLATDGVVPGWLNGEFHAA